MELLPADFSKLDLSREEKEFIRYISRIDDFGLFIINSNPTLTINNKVHILLTHSGIFLYKFFNDIDSVDKFNLIKEGLIENYFIPQEQLVINKLKGNKSLLDLEGHLSFFVTYVGVFPRLKYAATEVSSNNDDINYYMEHRFMFEDNFIGMRKDPITNAIRKFEVNSNKNYKKIDEYNVNAILQRICPEYVTIRVGHAKDEESNAGVDGELLVITEEDKVVKAFRLDKDQINIVNKIQKGEQLILACAGSGKSVLLVAKCFKAASMNPDKKFLITCYSSKLLSMYEWIIDRAGFKERNVECLTFHSLCKKLAEDAGYSYNTNNFEEWIQTAVSLLNKGKIEKRYYGIFIDEVQMFNTEWYKFCYNLLENKTSSEHLFVICGDKTQKLNKLQKAGEAPWNAGEGYPNYRGGNKSIRIERNYRNCIEINDYINRFVFNCKAYLQKIDNSQELDPEKFLRGKSTKHGDGVYLTKLQEYTNSSEAEEVVSMIQNIHDSKHIPYDEIAVVMYNGIYNGKIEGWGNNRYDLENTLIKKMKDYDIPYSKMYDSDESWSVPYGSGEGVVLIKCISTLGLDFRAVILCGLKPMGFYNKDKAPEWDELQNDKEKYNEMVNNIKININNLYVACTRAKETLCIILPENKEDSIYIKLLGDSY